MERISSFRESRPRYATLRIIGALCTLAGAILMVIGGSLFLFGLYSVATGGAAAGSPPAMVPIQGPQAVAVQWMLAGGFLLLWAVGILVSGLQFIGLGAFLRLMIHLEENTRTSAQALDRIRSRLEANPAGHEAPFLS